MDHQTVYTAPWKKCSDTEKRTLERELAKEVGGDHVLHGTSWRAVARKEGHDDVLFTIHNGVFRWAVVHLNWSGIPSESSPDVEFYLSRREWIERGMNFPS